jgi:Ca-activated chloride channel family protein
VDCAPSGEFQLLLPVRRGLIGTTVVTHAPGGGDQFAMLVVSPPVLSNDVVLPRDLTLVVDVSGSMSGGKMEQARAALNQALGTLRAADRFRVIAFSSGITEFANGYTTATAANVRQAREFVDNLEARGGTNIAGALEAALGERQDPERMGIVLFMTDGLPSVGEQAPERIAASAAARRHGLRIFPIGVGHDVNTYLLDRLALEGKGRVEYVAPDANVETALGQVFSRIDAPVLTDLRIVSSPVRFIDRVPGELPDLFSGEELVVFARYQGEASGDIVIEGTRNGRRERFTRAGPVPRPSRPPTHGSHRSGPRSGSAS